MHQSVDNEFEANEIPQDILNELLHNIVDLINNGNPNDLLDEISYDNGSEPSDRIEIEFQ